MNLYTITRTIEKIATLEHVNSTFVGDIYELNSRQDISYPAFVITQGTHRSDYSNENYLLDYNLFFVDRLTEDKSNELAVQDWAMRAVQNVVERITDSGIGFVSEVGNITPFSERFDSLCAGAFGEIRLNVKIDSCDEAKLVTSVNGKTGDVVIPTIDNLKTINGESLIGEGDIKIEVDPDLNYHVNKLAGEVFEFNETTLYHYGDILKYTDPDTQETSLYKLMVDSYKGEWNYDIVEETSIGGELADKFDSVNNELNMVNQTIETTVFPLINTLITKTYDLENTKQDTLISGNNIKTVNGNSLLGSGNIEIKGGTGDIKGDDNYITVYNFGDTTYVAATNKSTAAIDSMNYVIENNELYLQKPDTSYIRVNPNEVEIANNGGTVIVSNEDVSIQSGAYSLVNTSNKVDTLYDNVSYIVAAQEDINKELYNETSYLRGALANKQDALISGTNIKTVNGNSLLGSGNIEIKGGGKEVIGDDSYVTVTDVDDKSKISLTEDTQFGIEAIKYVMDNQELYLEYPDTSYVRVNPNDVELSTTEGKYSLKEIKGKVDELELFKFPNVTMFGTPTVQNGQLSDFSAVNYAQFPFLVDFKNRAFEINMCFTTGNQVTAQENIFDSIDGLAFAVRNGKFVIAMSSDGQTWNMGEHIGKTTVRPNTTYYVKFTWNMLQYKLEISTNKTDYVNDITVTDTRSLFAKQIIIGKSTDNAHIFGGSINLNYCSLSIMGLEIWRGMDDVGLSTRLATDMSNIDNAGVEYINGLIDDKVGYIDVALMKILYGAQPTPGIDIPDTEPLTFYKLDENVGFISIDKYGNSGATFTDKQFQYNKNSEGWLDYTEFDKIPMNQGDVIQFRSLNNLALADATNGRRVITDGVYQCGGNVMSLLNYTDTVPSYGFSRLFQSTNIISTPAMLATTVNNNGCQYMYYMCKYITHANELPATTVGDKGYQYMFYKCTSLEITPKVLPALILGAQCYSYMFGNCDSLITAPELPATTLAVQCYEYMFTNCMRLTNIPNLQATNLAEFCYSNMFNCCISLVNAQKRLPATIIADGAYNYMFAECTSLQNAPELPAEDIYSINCYNNMFVNCLNLKEIKCNVKTVDAVTITNIISRNFMTGANFYGTFYKNKNWNGPTVRTGSTILPLWTIIDWNL